MPFRPLFVRAMRACLDYALPPRCPGCGCMVGSDRQFCPDCWPKLDFLSEQACARCGMPFEVDEGAGAECGACLDNPPAFDSARAVLAYGALARRVAMRLKYGRRLGMAQMMADHMVRCFPSGAGDGADWLIVPVPLHRWRLWHRGFNQAAVIADHLSRLSGVRVDKQSLVRSRSTKPLRNMKSAQRRKAVRGAFAVERGREDAFRGRHILLIDDIHTTGATADACTAALRRAGASSVHLLCWARVLPHRHDDRESFGN